MPKMNPKHPYHTPEITIEAVASENYEISHNGQHITCLLTLENGFVVTGKSRKGRHLQARYRAIKKTIQFLTYDRHEQNFRAKLHRQSFGGFRAEEWGLAPHYRTNTTSETTASPAAILAGKIIEELNRARTKFPGKNVTFAALIEEVGELATALFDEGRDRVQAEAIQVAVMAMRVILDGDHTFEPWRASHNLDPLITHPATEKLNQ